MSSIPLPQQIYKHFKGNLYKVITVAEHSETGEKLVVYQAMYGERAVYARPLSMFMEKIDTQKYPEAKQEYRFELQSEADNEEVEIDPLVLEFLDADTYEKRLNILAALQHRITDDMITTMAIAADVEIPEGDTQERYEELKSCLLTFERYEGSRLR